MLLGAAAALAFLLIIIIGAVVLVIIDAGFDRQSGLHEGHGEGVGKRHHALPERKVIPLKIANPLPELGACGTRHHDHGNYWC